jgi:hypothetical protein
MTENQDPAGRRWVDEAEEALNRAAEALKNAWEGTREARMSTLEAAKAAATKLGEAIEEGIALAKETWDPAKKPTDQVDETTADEEE